MPVAACRNRTRPGIEVDSEGAGQSLDTGRGDEDATTALAAFDPAELEQPAGDGGGQRPVQMPAPLGPVDAGAGEVPA